uniref:Uncharacterized protein n=1 Tax=Rhizophora mucronata TaxID=61149 RepID=A0A2P2QDZ8_RHIMU
MFNSFLRVIETLHDNIFLLICLSGTLFGYRSMVFLANYTNYN